MNSIDYKNILVAVDGSEEAEWALKKAIYLAKLSDATLVRSHTSWIQGISLLSKLMI